MVKQRKSKKMQRFESIERYGNQKPKPFGFPRKQLENLRK